MALFNHFKIPSTFKDSNNILRKKNKLDEECFKRKLMPLGAISDPEKGPILITMETYVGTYLIVGIY